MDYYRSARDDIVHQAMYPTEFRKDFFPKGSVNDSLKLGPKPPCKPKFVTKIEGNAVEEGARVFFEGIVDSQPQPIFTWYFDDEEIFPGEHGWEDAEIHHSRKMSTLIISYVREHHMGKYTLVAKNRLGHDVSNCDLIVRKKQFPPVFWKRIKDTQVTAGSRLVVEVEVGGWPLPEITWFKDGEEVQTVIHTENYNGYPNAYVPERKIEVKKIDEIRYCIIFHRISESDSGIYTCRAVNPLGEAVCEGEFKIEPGEAGSEELWLPEKWRHGKRLTWKDEDARLKPFVGYQEPGLTDEDIANMAKRVATTPLNRAMEYFANLPEYKPTPMSAFGLLPMNFSPDSALKGGNVKPRTGKMGGKPSWPSKFIPGDIKHYGYGFEDMGIIAPMWRNPLDPKGKDPNDMHYRPIIPDYPRAPPPKQRAKSPDCPHVWESHETIDRLYQILAKAGFKLDLDTIRNDQIGTGGQPRSTGPQSHLKDQVQARKNLMQSARAPRRGDTAAEREWESRLNADVAGAQMNAESFTREFMHQLASQQEVVTVTTEVPAPETDDDEPPALPPKTKIMFSPSRDVFSPTQGERVSSPVEYIPVKEKAKMIEQQQEEIERREAERRKTASVELAEQSESVSEEQKEEEESMSKVSGESLKGGVRILPPSPVTVLKETTGNTSESESGYSEFRSTKTFEQSESSFVAHQVPSNIPVLEDKYNVNENLEELAREREESEMRAEEERKRKEQEEIMRQRQLRLQQQQQEEKLLQQRQQMVSSYSPTPESTYRYASSSSSGYGYTVPDSQKQGQTRLQSQSYCMVLSSSMASSTGPGGQMRTTTTTTRYASPGYQGPRSYGVKTREEIEFEALMREEEMKEKMLRKQQSEERKKREVTFQDVPSTYTVTSPPSETASAQFNLRQTNQSPSEMRDEDQYPKYRSSPGAPFQPAFYKTPQIDPDRVKNASYRLPSQKSNPSNEIWTRTQMTSSTVSTAATSENSLLEPTAKDDPMPMKQDPSAEESYDGDTEF